MLMLHPEEVPYQLKKELSLTELDKLVDYQVAVRDLPAIISWYRAKKSVPIILNFYRPQSQKFRQEYEADFKQGMELYLDSINGFKKNSDSRYDYSRCLAHFVDYRYQGHEDSPRYLKDRMLKILEDHGRFDPSAHESNQKIL